MSETPFGASSGGGAPGLMSSREGGNRLAIMFASLAVESDMDAQGN